jgi:hypothetical protein
MSRVLALALLVATFGCSDDPAEADAGMVACQVFRCDNPNPTICACPDDKGTGAFPPATSSTGIAADSSSTGPDPVVDSSSTGPDPGPSDSSSSTSAATDTGSTTATATTDTGSTGSTDTGSTGSTETGATDGASSTGAT